MSTLEVIGLLALWIFAVPIGAVCGLYAAGSWLSWRRMQRQKRRM